MGGFITTGLTGPLVTVGLGGEVVLIIDVPVEKKGTLVYHKRRVEAIELYSSHIITLLQMQEVTREQALTIFHRFNIGSEARIKLLRKIFEDTSNSLDIGVTIIKKVGNNTVLKHAFLHKTSKPITLLLERLISKATHIIKIKQSTAQIKKRDTKVLNTTDIIEDIEKTDILDLIDKLDDLDEE